MNPTRPHIAVAFLLAFGGSLASLGAAAVVSAALAVYAGMVVAPSDALLIEDLVAVVPFIVAYAGINLATARGLASGRAWAVVSASVLALGTVAMGAVALLLIVLGGDPAIVSGAAAGSAIEGLVVTATFTVIYLAVLAALRVDGLPAARALPATA